MKKSPLGALSTEDRRGIGIFIAGAIALLGLIAFFAVRLQAPENDYDRMSLCNESLPRYSHNIFLIDVSDTLSEYQRRFLHSRISSLLEVSKENDRFTIFVLDEKFHGLSEPVVDLCKPKSADDADALTSNRLFVEKLYRDRFQKPFEQAIASVVAAGEQEVSPIYEALSDVASLNRFDLHAQEVNLTIVSDMIQNSRSASVFSSGSAAIERLPAIDLRRARTKVFWLDREKYKRYQTPELANSWEDYLASVSRFEQIERVRH
ncbi:hypothetical protein [Microbulbifer taiwanensis]|uniref:VWA domain-containing protein n=1 Tax=Microbulbifer taiwanensis TaxID=986746 RepID=A0ABW1YKW6_9GAMM|nr:hypothetical protein [Microbulbifer taiwanensis]